MNHILDNEGVQDYLSECPEHLDRLEAELLALEHSGLSVDEQGTRLAIEAAHFIHAGAADFDLTYMAEIAQQTEILLSRIRTRELAPGPEIVGALLAAVDRLNELVKAPFEANRADIAACSARLTGLLAERAGETPARSEASKTPERSLAPKLPAPTIPGTLCALVVEDDFTSRLLLQTVLSRYGQCHIAVNGKEAVDAVRAARERGEPYGLICMDIMMPEMDGQTAVRAIREHEAGIGILSGGVRIVMTTAVSDIKEVMRSFHGLCDAYLLKPVDVAQLLAHIRSFQLIP